MQRKKIITILALLISPTIFAVSFQGIGMPPSDAKNVVGISADKTIVSHYSIPNWIWTNMMYTTPSYPGGIIDISDDGSTIIGYVSGENSFYTVTNGVVNIIPGVAGFSLTTPTAISANGLKIVGTTRGGVLQTPGWVYENGSYTQLPLPDGATGTHSLHISNDGSVIAGTVWGGSAAFHVVLWENDNINVLPNPEGEFFTACAISGDGKTVAAGHYRWQDGIIDIIPILTGFTSASVKALSFDGSVVFGNAYNDYGSIAFVWDEINGTRLLKDFLEDDYGLDLTNWNLLSVSATDASGNIITGYGINPQGKGELWIAQIPEPATIALIAMGLGLMIKKRT